MKIGIDARLIDQTGVGRYIKNLILELANIDTTNQYVVFTQKGFKPPNKRWTINEVSIPWHSIKEQLTLPKIFLRQHLDLLHVPYFTIPILYPGKFIVTMHDLTILHYLTGKATTLPFIQYILKHISYRLILEVGLHRARHIISVSQATKDELLDHFALDERKISVIYEGVSIKTPGRRLIKEPYFLYVGNAYPHKNLDVIFQAIGKQKIVFVGKEDVFYKKLPQRENITYFGYAADSELTSLYAHAKALIFPSLMEGFGLPVLEAASYGTPVICSDIPAFREILGPIGNYFDPRKSEALKILLEGPLRTPSKEEQNALRARFSWRDMAIKTLKVYENSARI